MKYWIIAVAFGLLVDIVLAQESLAVDRQLEQALGVDIAPSFPQQVSIEGVNLNAMTIRIDGFTYRLPPQGASTISDRLGVSLRDLRPGSEVFIQTDGTEPSADHQPYIIRMWKE